MRRRLDLEMVRRGLAGSRSEAALAIRSGKVTVSGNPATKASTMVLPGEPIVMMAPARRYVSRGGDKLEAAFDRFGITVKGLRAMDAGASTGGFTDCLLSRGAAHVIAVDVGYGQLDWRLREDPRVTVLERTNVRDLVPTTLMYPPDIITADLSFISLRLVLPALVRSAAAGAAFVLLVKPQFEAGREEVGPGGVVRDPDVWRMVLHEVIDVCRGLGLDVEGVMASPVVGPAGNVEFLLHARKSGSLTKEESFGPDIEAAVEEALELARSTARGAGRSEASRG